MSSPNIAIPPPGLGQHFENLVEQLLRLNGFKISRSSTRTYDFTAEKDQITWAIEAKYYRTPRAQMSLIEIATVNLIKNAVTASAWKAMLVVSCSVLPEARAHLEERYNVRLVDRFDLVKLASKHPKLLDELYALLEWEPHAEILTSSAPKAIDQVERVPATAPKAPTEGSDLCTELRALKRGRATWSAYEKLCDKILKYLFPNDLHGWHKQKRTDDGLNRFDYVCRIRSNTDFWKFIAEHLNSRYMLFEFKNYSHPIKQGQVLTTEKYLLDRGLRRAAIIFSRSGADAGALATMQGAMREHGKLMLVLDDDQICKMLEMKERGEDPTDLLFDVADEFLLSLPR